MTREQIERLEAGAEADAACAEAMGWTEMKFYSQADEPWWEGLPSGEYDGWRGRRAVPEFSTDIAAAWGLVEAGPLLMNGDMLANYPSEGGWTYYTHQGSYTLAQADSAPLCLCRAFLLSRLPHP